MDSGINKLYQIRDEVLGGEENKYNPHEEKEKCLEWNLDVLKIVINQYVSYIGEQADATRLKKYCAEFIESLTEDMVKVLNMGEDLLNGKGE
jgi:hypothetical protein